MQKTWSTSADAAYDVLVVPVHACRKGNELLKRNWILFWWAHLEPLFWGESFASVSFAGLQPRCGRGLEGISVADISAHTYCNGRLGSCCGSRLPFCCTGAEQKCFFAVCEECGVDLDSHNGAQAFRTWLLPLAQQIISRVSVCLWGAAGSVTLRMCPVQGLLRRIRLL